MNESLPTWMERAIRGEYVEDYELKSYVWKHYKHALTEREQALHLAATLELKARLASTEATAAKLRHMPGYFCDAEVAAIAETGLGAFEQQCCQRLLHDHADHIYINRCERCHRIVASPIACACLWCHHHWYERRSEMVARSTSDIYPTRK